jgi:EthD domain
MTKATGAASRREVLEGGLLAFAAAGGATATAVSPAQAVDGTQTDRPQAGLKFVSLLARKQGLTREQFQQAWLVDHVELAYACPGILRYTLTVAEQASTRRDVASFDLEIDGIAELDFADRALSSSTTHRLRPGSCVTMARPSSAGRSIFSRVRRWRFRGASDCGAGLKQS